MKFSRIFYSRTPIFFHFHARLIFAQRHCQRERVWFYQTKTSRMLVFCWYLVIEKNKLKICLLRIAQFYFAHAKFTFFSAILFSHTYARITLIRVDYIFSQEHCAIIKLTQKFHIISGIFM